VFVGNAFSRYGKFTHEWCFLILPVKLDEIRVYSKRAKKFGRQNLDDPQTHFEQGQQHKLFPKNLRRRIFDGNAKP
jgi:hypothetical protein